jgi:photosystem II stability/assembly factor-like uncharacterized protein
MIGRLLASTAVARCAAFVCVLVLLHPRPMLAAVEGWTGSGPSGGRVQALAIDPSAPGILYAGGRHGLFKSVNGGATWTRSDATLPNRAISAILVLPSGAVYAGTEFGLYSSLDGGATWALVNGLTSAVTALAAGTNGARLYAAFGSQLLTSVNGGASWTPGNLIVFLPIVSLAVNPTNADIAYASSGSSVVKTVDGGSTWTATTLSVPSKTAGTLAIDPLAPDTVYVAVASTGVSPLPGAPSVAQAEVYKTINGGSTWSQIVQLDANEFRAILPHPTASGTVFLGTSCAVEGEPSWREGNTGLVLGARCWVLRCWVLGPAPSSKH